MALCKLDHRERSVVDVVTFIFVNIERGTVTAFGEQNAGFLEALTN